MFEKLIVRALFANYDHSHRGVQFDRRTISQKLISMLDVKSPGAPHLQIPDAGEFNEPFVKLNHLIKIDLHPLNDFDHLTIIKRWDRNPPCVLKRHDRPATGLS